MKPNMTSPEGRAGLTRRQERPIAFRDALPADVGFEMATSDGLGAGPEGAGDWLYECQRDMGGCGNRWEEEVEQADTFPTCPRCGRDAGALVGLGAGRYTE